MFLTPSQQSYVKTIKNICNQKPQKALKRPEVALFSINLINEYILKKLRVI